MESPAQFRQLFFDVGKRQLQGGTSMRAGSSLRQDAFALHFEGLLAALLLRILELAMLDDRLRSGSLCLLLLNGLTFPSTRHDPILRRSFASRVEVGHGLGISLQS